jgi:hypothetical protein
MGISTSNMLLEWEVIECAPAAWCTGLGDNNKLCKVTPRGAALEVFDPKQPPVRVHFLRDLNVTSTVANAADEPPTV